MKKFLIASVLFLVLLTACGKTEVPLDVKEDAASMGDANAKITITEYSDFECPFCGKAARDVLPDIKKDYVDTGKVKIVFKNFPLPAHRYSRSAAYAAECANQQGKFWEYHELLFNNQDKLTSKDLKSYGEQVGLDMAAFDICIDHSKIQEKVQLQMQEGINKGVTGTPTFIFSDGTRIEGITSVDSFKQSIDKALARAS